MKQYYEAELIKEIVGARGHEKSSLHYESECVESWIEETKGAYPKLCDYQSEWLSYINKIEGGGTEQPNPEPPIGEFPYVVLSDVTEATVDNVVPYAYKSAILKGKTAENLQSVKNPVLKTLNNQSNLFFTQTLTNVLAWRCIRFDTFIKAEIYAKADSTVSNTLRMIVIQNINGAKKENIFTNDSIKKGVNVKFENVQFIGFHDGPNKIEENANGNLLDLIEYGKLEIIVSDKSNILTVNEDVTLRSNGNVYDELDLLTAKLTQRIDEDGSVMTQEVDRTVDLNIQDQDGKTLSVIKPIEGKMFLSTSSDTINPLFSGEIPVEAITQNLASFIDLEMEE